MHKTLLDVPSDCMKPMPDWQSGIFHTCLELERHTSSCLDINSPDLHTSWKNDPSIRILYDRTCENGKAKITIPLAIFISSILKNKSNI